MTTEKAMCSGTCGKEHDRDDMDNVGGLLLCLTCFDEAPDCDNCGEKMTDPFEQDRGLCQSCQDEEEEEEEREAEEGAEE